VTASTGSAFPPSVAELVPQAREWMTELGTVPSRNQIKTRFRVGAPKANAIRAALTDTGSPGVAAGSGVSGPVGDGGPVRALRPVPDPAPDKATDLGAAPVDNPTPVDAEVQVTPVVDPGTDQVPGVAPTPPAAVDPAAVAPGEQDSVPGSGRAAGRPVRRWPVILLALPAFVAIWGGWVGLGQKTGFGPIRLLPGIWDDLVVNSAITLPIGVETYAALALHVWLSGRTLSGRARRFAKWSAFGSLVLGMAGQVAYHQMSAAGVEAAPWLITTFVACLPVVVLGCGAALLHLMHEETHR
jgi:hypothetical protein